MTVAYIKEYIDEHIDDDEEVHTTQELRTLYGSTLDEIKSMLDELEPKAKWVKKNNDYYCSNCGSEYHTSSITPLPDVCIECGARMEDEQ